MSRKKTRDLLMVGCVALFFLTKQILFLWFIAFVAIIFSNPKSSGTKTRKANRRKKYLQDAEALSILVPNDHGVHERLTKIYRKVEDAKRHQPQLSKDFDDLLEDLWQSLALEERAVDWRVLLDEVIDRLPQQSPDARKSLRERIRKVQDLSEQLSDARKEAYGK